MRLSIYRYDPDKDDKPRMQDYDVPLEPTDQMLLDALVAWARKTGTRVRVTCPYARSQFVRDPSIRDVLDRPIR